VAGIGVERSNYALSMAYPFVILDAAMGLTKRERDCILLVFMAKQVGDIKIVGTLEDLCFYKMQGEYFVRMKSSLTGKRFWKDRAFVGSRRSAGLLAKASSLASRLYRLMPKEKKDREVFRALTGKVKRLLCDGWAEAQVEDWFVQAYLPAPKGTVVKARAAKTKKSVRKSVILGQGQRLSMFTLLPPPVNKRKLKGVAQKHRLNCRDGP
jgi:hypothetical protein